jgi:DNA invertase Pin-like site-specific DNA recombinase
MHKGKGQAGKRIGYVRVSSADQNTEHQLEGMEIDRVYTDKASGKDTHRPKLADAIDYLRDGDTLIVHSMDRLARNTEDLLRLVREVTEKGATVEFLKEKLTFNGHADDPISHLMLSMLGAFAQFERTLIRERQREGIELAKAKGVYKGRKAALTAEQAAQLQARVTEGETKAAVARNFGISRETLYQYLRSGTAQDGLTKVQGPKSRTEAPADSFNLSLGARIAPVRLLTHPKTPNHS